MAEGFYIKKNVYEEFVCKKQLLTQFYNKLKNHAFPLHILINFNQTAVRLF